MSVPGDAREDSEAARSTMAQPSMTQSLSGQSASIQPTTGPLPATQPPVLLGDLLGAIRTAVQAEVADAVARMSAQQQPIPAPLPPGPNTPPAATLGKCITV